VGAGEWGFCFVVKGVLFMMRYVGHDTSTSIFQPKTLSFILLRLKNHSIPLPGVDGDGNALSHRVL